MIIELLDKSIYEGRPRISAIVKWEDSDRSKQEIFFETEKKFYEDLTCHAHPFLVACLIPAAFEGEQRIKINGEICPELLIGLETANKLIYNWYLEDKVSTINIETKRKNISNCIKKNIRTGFFFSGGVDSLATLRANRLSIPRDHPGSIHDGILVFGLEVTDPRSFSHVREAMHEIEIDAGINLVPIYTNIRELNKDWHFWQYQWGGAVLSAIAHCLATRIGTVHIASTHDIKSLIPYGSHPLLDPLFSSCSMEIKHDGIGFSRLERAKLISGWEVARNNLRVCNRSEDYENGRLNCGKCEKCIRTMLELLAIGALGDTKAFKEKDVSSEVIQSIQWIRPASRPYYLEMIAPLRKRDRPDLANAVENKLQALSSPKPKNRRQSTLDAIWRLDRIISGGRLYRIGKKILG